MAGQSYQYKVGANGGFDVDQYPAQGNNTFTMPAEAGSYNITFTFNAEGERTLDFECVMNEPTSIDEAAAAVITAADGRIYCDKDFVIVNLAGQDVTAANGEVRNYVLETVIEISDNTGLEALYVDGELVDGFVPEIDEYYYSLPFGSTFVDETIVTYQAAESGQTVTLYKDGMDVKVSVTAQDGSSMRVYTIHFVSSSFDPSKQATLEDVCVTSTADGYWKFTTKCNNVYVCLADLSGRPIANVMLPLVDPNVPDICSPSAEGYLYVPQSSEVLIYFFHSNGHRITSGKIRTHN